MPVEVKPLFRSDVLRPLVQAFLMPGNLDTARSKLAQWADILASGRVERYGEKELLPGFLRDIFCDLLGYTDVVASPGRYTFSIEKHVEAGGEFADAVLGDFQPGQMRFVAAVEGKGPKDPLDRPFAGRKKSAVDQGLGYAVNLKCDWYIITSIRQTRLYYKGSDQFTFERFDTEALAADPALLKKFVYLMGAKRVVPVDRTCHFADLLKASERVGRDLTKEFYLRYADIREQAFEQLCRSNPTVSRKDVLAATQTLLDRVLFSAFCEDRGLLPTDTISRAYTHSDPYNPRTIWDNFKGLFRAIDLGNSTLNISAYNGGLFALDPILDGLTVPDNVCRFFQILAEYEYRPPHEVGDEPGVKVVDVEILGHIFEQSITDLERIHNALEGREEETTRRKREGAFYTPSFITRYIVGQALGHVLDDRFEALRKLHADEALAAARTALADPKVYDLTNLKKRDKSAKSAMSALIRFWEAWQSELATVRVLDPACGSGAFLIEAFEQLYQAYERSNDHLADLRGHRTLFDLDRQILQDNLYGVDLNEEAIEICRLSLWIKTARRGKALTSLDHTIRIGNSLIDDPRVHPRAFAWKAAFPEVFERGGFDVVVGNPPYIRQEWLSPYKLYFQRNYKAYHGVADIYVYFYELGMRLLRPGGRLSFVVTNKWLKAAYAEPLRKFFAEETWVESVVDFGHAKQIFPDADVFPSIIVTRKPDSAVAPEMSRVCVIAREQLMVGDLGSQIDSQGFHIQRGHLASHAWSLEPKGVQALIEKLKDRGDTLFAYAGVKPFRGVVTGLNEAFLINTPLRDRLVACDKDCERMIKPYIRGQDIKRWRIEWQGLWMIVLKSSGDHTWPWSGSEENAEYVFRDSYPSLYEHFKPLQEQLIKRQDQGKYWWELRTCAFWGDFDKAKLAYQEIQFHPSYALDKIGMYGNNKSFFLLSEDLYLLSVLNSPVTWWYSWRYFPHMKDEALSPVSYLFEDMPIPHPDDKLLAQVTAHSLRLLAIHEAISSSQKGLIDWLILQYEVAEPSMRLRECQLLGPEALIAEVKKALGRKKPLSAAAIRNLREEHSKTIVPAQALAEEAKGLELRISDLVNEAYGLTPEEVQLMWDTAPPRMPIAPP